LTTPDLILFLDAVLCYSPPDTLAQLIPDQTEFKRFFRNAVYAGAVPAFALATEIAAEHTATMPDQMAAIRRVRPLSQDDALWLRDARWAARGIIRDFEPLALGINHRLSTTELTAVVEAVMRTRVNACDPAKLFQLMSQFLVPRMRISAYVTEILLPSVWSPVETFLESRASDSSEDEQRSAIG
jgi:hypothetical protein